MYTHRPYDLVPHANTKIPVVQKFKFLAIPQNKNS